MSAQELTKVASLAAKAEHIRCPRTALAISLLGIANNTPRKGQESVDYAATLLKSKNKAANVQLLRPALQTGAHKTAWRP